MSKNLTRKGYALGALVALAASVFAGAPAYAADSVVLAANSTDKTLAAPITETLTLNASLAPGSVAANVSQLKYKVVTDGTFVAKVVATGSATVTKYTVSEDSTRVGAAYTAANVKTSVYVAGNGRADGINTLAVSVDAVAGATDGANGVAPASTDTTRTVTITAFLDSNNNSLFDDGEAFQTQTVSFLKYSEITAQTTITGPVTVGNATTTASLKFTNINNEQLPANTVSATFSTGTDTNSETVAIAAWSATNLFKAVTAGTYIPAASTVVKVQPKFRSVNAGTAVTASVVAKSIDLLTADVVRSETAVSTGTNTADASLNKEFKVALTGSLSTLTTTSKVVSGVAVTASVSTNETLSSTVTITVNGTTYTSATTLAAAAIATTTDANGQAVLTISSVGVAAGKTITVSGAGGGVAASNSLVVTLQTPTYTTSSVYFGNSTSGTYTTTDGAAASVVVVVQDQFGANAPDSTFDVNASLSSSSQTTAATATSGTYAAVTGGKATLSILDNGTGTGTNVYTLALNKKASNGVYSSTSPYPVALNNVTIKIVSAADAAIGALALTDSASAALGAASATDTTKVITAGLTGASDTLATLATAAFANYDGRVATATNGAVTTVPVTIGGTVKSATTTTYVGVGIANSTVTISGTEMQFKSTQNGKDVYGSGTLTITADANGAFTFNLAGHLAGKQTVTITAGSVTSKVYVYFAAATEASASKVTVKVGDGAAQFQAGRALDVTFTVTDKYGNPVALNQATDSAKLTIAQTGAGYLTLSGDQATGTAGTFASKLITNFGDLGTSTITATVDFSDATVTDLVATNSSEFGVTDADVTVGGRAVYASVEFAKGKTVTVSVDGKRLYSKLFSTDAYTELKFTQKTAGKHTVTVRVSGGVVYSEVVTTTK